MKNNDTPMLSRKQSRVGSDFLKKESEGEFEYWR
jgi:hypothetical protein